MAKIILASQSPRRKELLTLGGYDFEVVVSDCEEVINSVVPHEVVCELSSKKAVDVLQKCKDRTDIDELIVIGADTVVSIDGSILGKPEDRDDAARMLRKLSGNTHEVYTGVTFAGSKEGKIRTHTFYECTRVIFYEMSDKEIEDYVCSGDCNDKAGAYGIQSGAARFVKGIEGDYNNVVGLPLSRVYQELKKFT